MQTKLCSTPPLQPDGENKRCDQWEGQIYFWGAITNRTWLKSQYNPQLN